MAVTVEYEIEYSRPDGEIDYLCVDFEGSITKENDGIGGYECWGFTGYDEGRDYFVCEKITWDKTKYNEKENKVIETYLDNNFEKIEKYILESFDERDLY
jgi:hypothetical protein